MNFHRKSLWPIKKKAITGFLVIYNVKNLHSSLLHSHWIADQHEKSKCWLVDICRALAKSSCFVPPPNNYSITNRYVGINYIENEFYAHNLLYAYLASLNHLRHFYLSFPLNRLSINSNQLVSTLQCTLFGSRCIVKHLELYEHVMFTNKSKPQISLINIFFV